MWKDTDMRTRFMIILVLAMLAAPATVNMGYCVTDSEGVMDKDFREIKKVPDYRLLVKLTSFKGKDFDTIVGFWIVVCTLIIFLIMLPLLQLGHRTINVYRPYEERLLKLNRLALEDLLAYHSQFKWGSYSGEL